MKIIVGLGNPGKEYEGTRHNVGWDVVRACAKKLDAEPFVMKKDFHADIAEGRVGEEKILFALPATFMNASGDAVLALKSFYKLDNRDILLVHDEMDFPAGRIAFATGAGPAGHNGVKSIQKRLATKDIARLRLGIGKPEGEMAKENYVLGEFTSSEATLVRNMIKRAAQAAEDWTTEGLTSVMNSWNGVDA